jgi:hypothetical protein
MRGTMCNRPPFCCRLVLGATLSLSLDHRPYYINGRDEILPRCVSGRDLGN